MIMYKIVCICICKCLFIFVCFCTSVCVCTYKCALISCVPCIHVCMNTYACTIWYIYLEYVLELCGCVVMCFYLCNCICVCVHMCMCVCVCLLQIYFQYHLSFPSPIKVVSFSLFTKNLWHLSCLHELDSCGEQSKAGPHNSMMEGIQGVG
jgi:hypothetical protein